MAYLNNHNADDADADQIRVIAAQVHPAFKNAELGERLVAHYGELSRPRQRLTAVMMSTVIVADAKDSDEATYDHYMPKRMRAHAMLRALRSLNDTHRDTVWDPDAVFDVHREAARPSEHGHDPSVHSLLCILPLNVLADQAGPKSSFTRH